jgi:ATP-dependent Clp protease adaptor protein ClpS
MASAPVIVPERTSWTDEVHEYDQVWNVIVWNDPVTLMSYVVFVLRKLFGYDEPTATKLMLQVHNEGKSVVASGPREKSESDVARLHAHGLQATLARE